MFCFNAAVMDLLQVPSNWFPSSGVAVPALVGSWRAAETSRVVSACKFYLLEDWMFEILDSFDDIVLNAANTYRLQATEFPYAPISSLILLLPRREDLPRGIIYMVTRSAPPTRLQMVWEAASLLWCVLWWG